MVLVLGVPLEECRIDLKRQSRQSFGIDWFNDEAQLVPSDLTGVAMTIILGDRDAPLQTWLANNTANRSVWTLDEIQSDLPFAQYDGQLLMDDGNGVTLLFQINALVEE